MIFNETKMSHRLIFIIRNLTLLLDLIYNTNILLKGVNYETTI